MRFRDWKKMVRANRVLYWPACDWTNVRLKALWLKLRGTP